MKKSFFWLLCAATLALTGCNENQPNSSTSGNTGATKRGGALQGVFSVSESTQVCFSMGNLQYTQSTDTWSFAENQYDYIGTDNVTGGTVESDAKGGTALADKIDLFGWSGSTGAKWGISTSTDEAKYSGDFVDWGQNAISNGGNMANIWRTLTWDEWVYVFRKRPNADNLLGVAKIDLGNGKYANGLILLPDDWQQPAGVSFRSGFANEDDVTAYGSYQSCTLSKWQKLEASGAVFLPAAGYRSGTYVSAVARDGDYWTGTPYEPSEDYAMSQDFYSYREEWFRTNRYFGHSIRLVQDIN